MYKGSKGLLTLTVLGLLLWQLTPAGVSEVESGYFDCTSTVSGAGGNVIVCPAGDGPRFDEMGAIISVTVRSGGVGMPGIIPSDIWLIGSNNAVVLCGGSGAIDADSATSAFPPVGHTTISGALKAGGCDTGLCVVVQGEVIGCPPTVLPYSVRSPDFNGDGLVDIIDLALFSPVYLGTQPYSPCMDLDWDGIVGLIDLALFGTHYSH
jgi:hypothetical protein